jgi:hypothetical protein
MIYRRKLEQQLQFMTITTIFAIGRNKGSRSVCSTQTLQHKKSQFNANTLINLITVKID